MWKSDLTDEMKSSFFQAVIVSILLYGFTIWPLTKRMEKRLDSNYAGMLRAIFKKTRRQHLKSSSYTATYRPSQKFSKLDEPDMQDSAIEVGMSSLVMYYYGPLHMAEQKQGDQLEPTYSRSVRRWGVALRTCRKRWTIGSVGEKGPGISMPMAQDDEMMIKIYIYIYI